MTGKLEEQLLRETERKMERSLNKKDISLASMQRFSMVIWNLFIPIIASIIIGSYASKMLNNNIFVFMIIVMLGVGGGVVSFVNTISAELKIINKRK